MSRRLLRVQSSMKTVADSVLALLKLPEFLVPSLWVVLFAETI